MAAILSLIVLMTFVPLASAGDCSCKTEIDTLSSRLTALENQPRLPRDITNGEFVAFHAQLTPELNNLGNHHTIVFDHVLTNIGNGYSNIDGIFTAPFAGTYAFFWSAMNEVHTYMNLELCLDTVPQGKTFSDANDHEDVAVASNMVILTMSKGQEVWLRTGTNHDRQLSGRLYTTFSGWLLTA